MCVRILSVVIQFEEWHRVSPVNHAQDARATINLTSTGFSSIPDDSPALGRIVTRLQVGLNELVVLGSIEAAVSVCIEPVELWTDYFSALLRSADVHLVSQQGQHHKRSVFPEFLTVAEEDVTN